MSNFTSFHPTGALRSEARKKAKDIRTKTAIAE
jgi:hypothetical protein